MLSRHPLIATTLAILICAAPAPAPAPALAQFRLNGVVVRPPGGPPEVAAGKELNQGVYVRDSGGAVEKLALAQRMERLKEWDKAADVYQEIIDKYSDRIVARPDNDSSVPRYANVTMIVQEALIRWPQEGMNAYHRRFDAPAATLLQQSGADDVAALNRICAQYFATSAGKTAALRLIELDLENAEFSAAAWVGQRLLTYHPELIAERPKVLFRTALAEHLAGDDAGAKAHLEELKQRHAQVTGIIRGKDTVLADELARLLEKPAPKPQGTSAESWPMFGGSPSRGRVADAAGRMGAQQKEIPLTRPPRTGPYAAQAARASQPDDRRDRGAGLTLGVMPVVDRGELFFQDNACIFGVSLESGMALPGWANTYPGEQGGRYASPNTIPLPPNTQMTVTVTDRAVLAVMRQYERITVVQQAGQINTMLQSNGETRLVCLDRITGAEKWVISPRQFTEQNLRTLELGGSPLVIGDNVYVCARGGKPMQFEDSYVLCFGATDGRLRWACYLASGNAMAQMMGNGPALSNVSSHLAYEGGRIYASTEIGAVAAVDAYNGTIVWLDLYPRPNQNFAAFQGGFPQPGMVARKPWSQNPVIVKDGKIFVLPSDGQHLLIYDAGTGAEIKRIPTDGFERAKTLLGVTDNKLIVASELSVYCINWPGYDATRPIMDQLFWKTGPLKKPQFSADSERDTIRGRGFVTSDSVFIPTQWALYRISLNGGKIEETYPKGGTWAGNEGPGNILVTQDNVVIAGADSVDIYTDMALARAKLDRAVEAAPNDAAPRLRYAEVMFASGQIEVALEKLDEAIKLIGGVTAMRPSPDRDQVFSDALLFAQRLSDPKLNSPERLAQAPPLYDRAAAAALSPTQQVNYRVSRAQFAKVNNDFANEVRLYQEILADSKLRGLPVATPDGPGTAPAAQIAEAIIRERIKGRPDLYAPYNKQAADALAAAVTSRNADQLLAVAQTYPVSNVAADALFAAADAFEVAGKPRQATQVLNQIYRKYLNADKARIIEAQARNYLALPNGVGVAIGRLNEGAKLPGPPKLSKPLKLPDGTVLNDIPFDLAAGALGRYSATLASRTLPDFKLPNGVRTKPLLPENPDTAISEVDQLLVPSRNTARNDRVIAWAANKGLSIYVVGASTPLGTNSTLTEAPRGVAWAGNNLIVWTAARLSLLNGASAAAVWELPVKSLPEADMIAAGADADRPPVVEGEGVNIPAGGGVVFDNQRIRVLRNGAFRGNFPGGRPVGPPPRPGAANVESIEHVKLVGERVVLATSTGRIAAVELSNGQVAWQARVADAAIDQLLANDDFVAARFTDDYGAQIVALDAFAGQLVLRRVFSPETGENPPQNMALSADGTLCYALPDRICGKDLYEPGKELKFGRLSPFENNQVFVGAIAADQLVVADGRILALSDAGQFVRVLSLENGREIASPIGTGAPANSWSVALRVVGPRLYIVNQKTVTSKNLDRAEDSWTGFIDVTSTPVVRDAFIGKNHIVLLDQGAARGNAGNPAAGPPGVAPEPTPAAKFRLLAYARYPKSDNTTEECGRLDYFPVISHPVGIDQWQGVDGGFYYRSLDRKLHYLQGSSK